MRRTLTAADAKNRFADALRQAEGGDVVLITRYGRPVAALVEAGRIETPTTAETPPEARETADAAPVDLEAAAEELRGRAAEVSLRRIDHDLARLPANLRPILELIRANLFQPRLTAERIRAAMSAGSHDLTTELKRATGATIRQYLEDRRLECVCRLLLDTELSTRGIARLTGYGGPEALSRAFRRRLGARPTVYREFGGRLAPDIARQAKASLPPLTPRYVAAEAALPEGTTCRRCDAPLEPGTAVRVFEDLVPICDDCGRRRAPALAALLPETTP